MKTAKIREVLIKFIPLEIDGKVLTKENRELIVMLQMKSVLRLFDGKIKSKKKYKRYLNKNFFETLPNKQ